MCYINTGSMTSSEEIENQRDSNPAYPEINEENNRYEYEAVVEIEGQLEPIHGGKIKKKNTE
jgi:hypothetical protein